MATKKTVKSVLKATGKTMVSQAKQAVANYSNLGKKIVSAASSVPKNSLKATVGQGLSSSQAKTAYQKVGVKIPSNTVVNAGGSLSSRASAPKINKLNYSPASPYGMSLAEGGIKQFPVKSTSSKSGSKTELNYSPATDISFNNDVNGAVYDTSKSRSSGVGNVIGSTNASGNSGLTSNIINAPSVLNPNNTKLTFPEPTPTPTPTITPVIPTTPEQTNTQTALEEYLASLGDIPSSTDAYLKAQKETDILQKQQLVNNLTGQLNTIVNQGQANQLNVVGQGRGIPEAILGGQQAQFARETAIAALPVQAQLSAAQGNLEMAQDNLDTLFKIYSEDAKNEYETKREQKKLVYDIATAKEKRALEIADKLEERAYQETKDLHEEQSMYAKMAFANNQASLGSQIAKLNYKSPTFKEDLSRLTSKLNDEKYNLEMQKLQNDLNNSGTTINTKVLNTTQFKAAQAAQNLKLTLEKAKAAVQKYGNREVISGEGAGILNSLKVQLRSEISTALEQGVVVPGEAEAFDQIAGQLNKSFFVRNKKTLASLNSLSSSMDGRIALQRSALTNTYGITPDQVDTLLNITNLSDQEFADMDAVI